MLFSWCLFVLSLHNQNILLITFSCYNFLFTDNVARCLSLVFNVIFTYMILSKTTSIVTCSTLFIVIIGFIVGIQGEIDFSPVGTAAGVLSSVFVSLNSIYTSKMLPIVDNDKSMLLYYNNLNATFLFIPLIFLFESQVIVVQFCCLLLSNYKFANCYVS